MKIQHFTLMRNSVI